MAIIDKISRGIECPVCKSQNTTKSFEISSETSAGVFVPRSENLDIHRSLKSHISSLWEAEHCEIRECDNCSFGFSYPHIAGDEKYYDLAYLRKNYPKTRWEYDRTISILRKEEVRRKSSVKVLELGAGDGLFLDQIVPWYVEPENVFAFDYHEKSIKSLRKKGYNAELADFLGRDTLIRNRFDSIFMYQVLEHMDRPHEVFDKLQKCLSSRGHLFISVPNKRLTDFTENTGSLIDAPPNHIGRWTHKSFLKMCEQHNLEMIDYEYEKMNLKHFVLRDLYCAHRSRAMYNRRFAGKVRAIQNAALRRNAIIAETFLFSPTRLLALTKALYNRNIRSGTLWVHLRKKES